MATSINLTYCGVEGTGPTVKIAKQDAARKLEALVERTRQSPYVVSVHGHTAIIIPTAYGWHYGIVADEAGVRPSVCWNGQEIDAHHAIDRAVSHMAQNAWSHAVDDEAFLAAVKPATPEMIRELRRYFLWQRAYRAARDSGMTDGQAHEHACRTA